jgi:hypothetical protein
MKNLQFPIPEQIFLSSPNFFPLLSPISSFFPFFARIVICNCHLLLLLLFAAFGVGRPTCLSLSTFYPGWP